MKVEIGTEAPIFLFWEYLFQIFVILSLQCSFHALVGVLALSVLLFLLVHAVVALISPAVYASSATVSGIPAVATANVSGVADGLAAIVVLSIPLATSRNR
jgi:hypothetical protein